MKRVRSLSELTADLATNRVKEKTSKRIFDESGWQIVDESQTHLEYLTDFTSFDAGAIIKSKATMVVDIFMELFPVALVQTCWDNRVSEYPGCLLYHSHGESYYSLNISTIDLYFYLACLIWILGFRSSAGKTLYDAFKNAKDVLTEDADGYFSSLPILLRIHSLFYIAHGAEEKIWSSNFLNYIDQLGMIH